MPAAPRNPHGSVLVGVDGSTDADHAVTWAAHEAARTGVALRIVHASPWSLLSERPGRCPAAWDETGLGHRARMILAAAAAHAHDVEPKVAVDAELVYGDGPAALARAASGVATVVVGRRGRGTEGTRHVGSAVAVLAEQVRATVVVCGYDAQHSQLGGHEGPVVVGVDNPSRADCSPDERHVLDAAFQLAARQGTRLTVVHAWNDADWGPEESLASYITDWETAAKDSEVDVQNLLTPWSNRFPQVPVTVTVVNSRPAHALVTASQGALAVVLGGSGRASLPGSRFGPVARRVATGSSCPVVIVPTQQV